MIDLLDMLKERLKTIFEGSAFEEPGSENSVEPLVKTGYLDPKRAGSVNDDDFPFVLIRPLSGSGDLREETITVQLHGGIYVSGDMLSGFTALEDLIGRLLLLQQERTFTPYRMALPFTWKHGEKDGQQPHPYYFVTVNLLFKRAPQALSRR